MNVEPTSPPARTSAVPLAEAASSPEVLISNLLRYGVMASLLLVAAGMLLTFSHHLDYFSSGEALQRLTAPEHAPHRLSDVLAGVLSIRGQAFVMTGLLVMIAIPFMRVALSLRIFSHQRDRAFVLMTAGVLALLLLSFLLGKAEGG